ncbi:MAG TPA: hypothetical protein PKY89_12605, partial [Deltaproteobacteria bacterium]|nr:hypothetical protein [Deltaproteobacteria bacterium]HPJ94743.1 hypothetical protein [Deltaproteobacteria bacterium]
MFCYKSILTISFLFICSCATNTLWSVKSYRVDNKTTARINQILVEKNKSQIRDDIKKLSFHYDIIPEN